MLGVVSWWSYPAFLLLANAGPREVRADLLPPAHARKSGGRCRAQAQTAQTAEIWLWDTASWAPAGRLAAHGLTVTQLAFSADGRHLASASRDRSFAVFAEATPGAAGEVMRRV